MWSCFSRGATRKRSVQDNVLSDFPTFKLWPETSAADGRISAVWIATPSHIGPKSAHGLCKIPLLVIEVCSVALVTKATGGIACFTTLQMGAIWGGQAPNATAATILHEVRLAKYKSNLILMCSSKIWQMKVGYRSAVGIASVPVVKPISKSKSRPRLVEPGSLPPDAAQHLVRLHVTKLVHILDTILGVCGIQFQGLLHKFRTDPRKDFCTVCHHGERLQGSIRMIIRLIQAVLGMAAEQEEIAVVGLGSEDYGGVIDHSFSQQLLWC
mmetsp:Transcript_16838/g.35196  ORF Transcript_16838/g.35196 Transcript_16838/m.35196 type:complete len:269 (+) Transcript_16838:345-1151(+)